MPSTVRGSGKYASLCRKQDIMPTNTLASKLWTLLNTTNDVTRCGKMNISTRMKIYTHTYTFGKLHRNT